MSFKDFWSSMVLSEEISVYKGCSAGELSIIGLVGLAAGLLLALIMIVIGFSLAISSLAIVIAVVLSLVIGSSYLQKIKRNNPKYYIQKLVQSTKDKSLANQKNYNAF